MQCRKWAQRDRDRQRCVRDKLTESGPETETLPPPPAGTRVHTREGLSGRQERRARGRPGQDSTQPNGMMAIGDWPQLSGLQGKSSDQDTPSPLSRPCLRQGLRLGQRLQGGCPVGNPMSDRQTDGKTDSALGLPKACGCFCWVLSTLGLWTPGRWKESVSGCTRPRTRWCPQSVGSAPGPLPSVLGPLSLIGSLGGWPSLSMALRPSPLSSATHSTSSLCPVSTSHLLACSRHLHSQAGPQVRAPERRQMRLGVPVLPTE